MAFAAAREEVPAALERHLRIAREPEVDLVHQRRRLQAYARPFARPSSASPAVSGRRNNALEDLRGRGLISLRRRGEK